VGAIKPTRVKGNGLHADYTETHPAYGQISANRVTIGGGGERLYGSELVHRSTIRIAITESHRVRNLNLDWHHDGKSLIEVELSGAQWASFISTLNYGSGTCCTIKHVQGEQRPDILVEETKREEFESEIKSKLEGVVTRLGELMKSVSEDSKIPAGKRKEIAGMIERALQDLGPNLGFVGEQFQRHMDDTTSSAKAEIEAMLTSVVQKAGIAALKAMPEVKLIEKKDPT